MCIFIHSLVFSP